MISMLKQDPQFSLTLSVVFHLPHGNLRQYTRKFWVYALPSLPHLGTEARWEKVLVFHISVDLLEKYTEWDTGWEAPTQNSWNENYLLLWTFLFRNIYHTHEEISWRWDTSLNMKFMSASCTPYPHALKITLHGIFSQVCLSHGGWGEFSICVVMLMLKIFQIFWAFQSSHFWSTDTWPAV